MLLPCIDGDTAFPPSHQALQDPDGLLCFGGDLSVKRLVSAYQQGIFPWFNEGEPIFWWSPNPRMVLYPHKFHISSSLKKFLKKTSYEVYLNRHFEAVIQNCAAPRTNQLAGTWIIDDMQAAYIELFKKGHAFCLEIEFNGELAGGIYGVKLDNIYCGESMFSSQSNGSKIAMLELCKLLIKENIQLLDCQIYNSHLESLGAELIDRNKFQSFLI